MQDPFTKKKVDSTEESLIGEVKQYPLQAIAHHNLARVHSTHANNDWLIEAFPQRVFINPLDAAEREIHDGDLIRVWNDRGELMLPARITPRILPGVVDIPAGAWWSPGEESVDFGGCVNVLTSERWTPFAFGTAQHTIMVQAQKVRK
jgi:anaerobic dimethyl sulfoxide reductase subunit A